MPDGLLVGLSLSRCVLDIAKDPNRLNSVACIITGTKCSHPVEFSIALRHYAQWDWKDHNPERCVGIAQQLWTTNRIVQPRLLGQPLPDISTGEIWIQLP